MQPSLSPLLTDLYQLTMAQGYFLSGIPCRQASFSVSFRENPFEGGYAIAAGIGPALDFLESFKFTEEDIAYLRTLPAADGTPLFQEDFLSHLIDMRFTCDVTAVKEGSIVFAREPIFTVTGPIDQCQLVETSLLNIINFSTLVATKAARCCYAANGDAILEFGLRRAQGPDGGVTASRAAYIGGCAATSNVLAGQKFDIPVAGTHAHSWIMAFDSEEEAFEVYARTSPNNVVLLVDTYDTIEGVKKAITVGLKMKAKGQRFAGIRLDSGDLAWLSKKAREMLDEAGLSEAKIVASNALDEYTILSLKTQGSRIDTWGVGTKLATAYEQAALNGVYKLTAVRNNVDEPWQHRLKISDQTDKLTIPGILGVRRYFNADGKFAGDVIYDSETDFALGSSDSEGECSDGTAVTIIDPLDVTRRKTFCAGMRYQELLVTMFVGGKRVYQSPAIAEVRDFAIDGLNYLDETQKRFLNPHTYPVGLEENLAELRLELVRRARGI